MTDGRSFHARASELFLELRGLDVPSRDRRLGAIDDPALREEVRSLLAHDVVGSGETDPAAGRLGPDPFEPGSAIGVYTIVRRLGRGSSGVVLLGEQAEPVRRRVAIKLVPHAMLDADHAARLDFERAALERTDHPGVPKVLDAGRTAGGMPYIVMEFVDGEPITRHCEARGLNAQGRVALMIEVAGAVQHAHMRGVIHRDLKPANILVVPGERGAPDQPKVVDFGIARATDPDAGLSLTRGRPLGTLVYMPPEQMGGGSVDTRADVYALGAVLYELVAGRPPVRFEDEADAMASAGTRPPTPLGRAPAGCGLSGSAWSDLGRVLRCALEKDPAHRYPTADAFAADLRRVLAKEPVLARTPTPVYRLAKLIERRKVASGAVAVAVLAVGVGVAGLGVGYAEATRQRALADERAGTLGAMNRFLIDDLLAAISPEEIAADTPAVVLLDRAAARIGRRFPDRPMLAAELHHTLGRSYMQLSAFDQAGDQLALAETLALEAEGDGSPQAVRTRLAQASLLAYRQRFDEAIAAFDALIPIAERVLDADDPALHAAWNDAGVAMDSSGRHAEGGALIERALGARRRTLGGDDPQVLLTLSNLAQVRDATGDTEGALSLMLEAVEVAEAMPDPPTMLLMGLHNNIGATYLDFEDHAAAAPHLERASELAQGWFGPDDLSSLILLSNVASLRSDMGDTDGAIEAFGRVVAGLTGLMGAEAYDTLIARQGLWTAHFNGGDAAGAEAGFADLVDACERGLGGEHWLTAAAMLSHARALHAQGRLAEARARAEGARGVFLGLLGADHVRTTTAAGLVAELDREIDLDTGREPNP